ncbi:SDR family NAD(P)-dependent oxidoreductase [Arthrobacter sp. B2a2-09]|uniref:SDR family NAD(P)-dependent oxidoreductase n=1 Tax=Arthrobacter sp. B2a2-09 TaxID=2952822 RepID=UPI0022CD7C7E|nr:SDR family NAD(P)-dependent oxidoreductase [Arthrobacter sp. B2a2-09]MCZ9884714.1 SDR family oxidoreductase [Arthrobacter sp. B2a2-09]
MADTENHAIRRVIITGGTRGIGRACAEHFARRGDRVLVCSRSASEAEAVAAELQQVGGTVEGMAADLADPEVGSKVVGRCVDLFGGVDALVNNAGIFESTALVDVTADDWDSTMHTNLRGPALTSAAAARVMRAAGHGSIVNIASINGLAPEANFAAYNASKAGLISLTRTTAIELADAGIRVNCVAPGLIRTPMAEPWITGLSDEVVARWAPMRRFGLPEEIASVVDFLISDASAYMTGETLRVDGGTLARQPVL